MSVSGLQRLRKLQIGYQTTFASNTGATKVLPYRGADQLRSTARTARRRCRLARSHPPAVRGAGHHDVGLGGQARLQRCPGRVGAAPQGRRHPHRRGGQDAHLPGGVLDAGHLAVHDLPVGRRCRHRLADRRRDHHRRTDDGLPRVARGVGHQLHRHLGPLRVRRTDRRAVGRHGPDVGVRRRHRGLPRLRRRRHRHHAAE